MKEQSRISRLLRKLWSPGWISLAIFVGYCTWFVIYNHPCDGPAVTIPLIIAFAFLTLILLVIKNPFINIGLSFGAIGGALFFTSSFLSFVNFSLSTFSFDYVYQMDEEFSLYVTTELMMGMVGGAIMGSAIGLLVLIIYRILNAKPYLQKVWIAVIVIVLLATLPWLYSISWGTFGYRWVINELVRGQGDELFEALVEYDDRVDFAYDSMYVYSYVEDKVELWIATRDKPPTGERFWMVVYELELENGVWKVSDVYGRCGYECMGCYRKSYVFQN